MYSISLAPIFYNLGKEKSREYSRQYYQLHREERRKYAQQYRMEHPEQIQEYNHQYRQEHKEEINIRKGVYRKLRPELHAEMNRRSYQKHAEKARQSRKNWREANPEKMLSYKLGSLQKMGKQLDLRLKQVEWALRSWSKMIRKRDNHECQICGSKDQLRVHHLLHKQFFPDLAFNPNNGITLCNKCHNEVHWRNLNV